MTMPGEPTAPTLRLNHVSKAFGGTQAVADVDLSFYEGQIHAIIGENGAGKSTLVNLITGQLQPDSGTMEQDGQQLRIRSPRTALRRGICLVSQELAIVPTRSVLDNVFCGSMPARFGFLNREKMRRRFEEVSQYAGIQLPSEKWLRFLSLAQREHVEILRALIHRPRLIVLDEPTAVLGKEESDHLLDLLRLLAREGTAVVFVSHYLDEVLSVADVVSVMRDGHLVSSGPAREQTVPSLIRSMVGRDIEQFYQDPVPVKSDAPVVLHAVGLGRGSAVNDVDITVHAGEIVGLAGLVGAGRSECARLLFGADRNDRGTIEIGLRQFRHLHPQTAMRLGVALVPESRRDDGLLMMRSVRENIGLASLRQHSRFGFIRRRAEREAAREVAAQCDIRMPGLGSPVRQLSGGNQQKALFARWMLRQPKVFIADEPTRGVDIGAKAQIHELILQMARDGIGVLLISSEVEEIVGLAHRVLVMRHGKIVDEVVRGEGNRERIIASAFGATLDGVA